MEGGLGGSASPPSKREMSHRIYLTNKSSLLISFVDTIPNVFVCSYLGEVRGPTLPGCDVSDGRDPTHVVTRSYTHTRGCARVCVRVCACGRWVSPHLSLLTDTHRRRTGEGVGGFIVADTPGASSFSLRKKKGRGRRRERDSGVEEAAIKPVGVSVSRGH